MVTCKELLKAKKSYSKVQKCTLVLFALHTKVNIDKELAFIVQAFYLGVQLMCFSGSSSTVCIRYLDHLDLAVIVWFSVRANLK